MEMDFGRAGLGDLEFTGGMTDELGGQPYDTRSRVLKGRSRRHFAVLKRQRLPANVIKNDQLPRQRLNRALACRTLAGIAYESDRSRPNQEPSMRHLLGAIACLLIFFTTSAFADEKGVFDYEQQKGAGDKVKKIVFIADAGTHGGRGNHEFMAGSILLARTLNEVYPEVHAVVHSTRNWPTDLSHANAIVVSLNHGQKAATDPNIAIAVKKGSGFMAIHLGVEVNKGAAGENYSRWMGGYFETFWSVNPWWTPEFKDLPEHAITRGVKPFSVRDEWYYHMRYVPDMVGVTPILSAVAPLNTVRKEPSDRGGNAAVFEEVTAGKPQVMAWAYEREDGGRGFGFTGMHNHANLGNDSFRTVLLNGAAWVAKLEIPQDGVPSKSLAKEDLEKLIDEGKKAIEEKK
jgi:hypothetical protein